MRLAGVHGADRRSRSTCVLRRSPRKSRQKPLTRREFAKSYAATAFRAAGQTRSGSRLIRSQPPPLPTAAIGKTGRSTAGQARRTGIAPISADNEVAQFCSNVADPAVDARLAWQLKELEKAEDQLRERIAEVEAKRAEYEKWMALRDEFLKKAEASVVEIYSRMQPEAARTQIAGMADETAAAVLAKLSAEEFERDLQRDGVGARGTSRRYCLAECVAWTTERPSK